MKISSVPGDSGEREKVSLVEEGVHEFVHALEFVDGSGAPKGVNDPDTGNAASEQPAVHVENAYREVHGLEGRRDVY